MTNATSDVDFRPALLPSRLAARAIDVAVVAAVDAGLGRLLGFGFDWLVLAALVVMGYFTLQDWLAGATIGKALLGLKVIGPDGGNPSLVASLKREAFLLLGSIPFIGPLLALGAWAWIMVSIRKSPLAQGKHDMLAGGTRVVHSR